MRRWWSRLAAAALLLLLAGVESRGDGEPADARRVVRVAFCPERGVCERTEAGVRMGVVPAWMWRLAERRKWKVEWVDLPYQEGLNQVAEGKVDIMGGVRKDSDSNLFDKLAFSTRPMGLRRESIYVLTASPFKASNLSTLKGCKVGVVKGCARINQLVTYFATRGMLGMSLVAYADAYKLERALFAGEVGAVLSDITENLAEERELMQVSLSNSYFVTARGNKALMEEIDTAMHEIDEEEPNLARGLRSMHFPKTREFELLFTSAEQAWIARMVREGLPIVVDISPEDPPFKVFDPSTGHFTGELGELVDELRELTSLPFEAVPPTSVEKGMERFRRGEIDIWLPYADGSVPDAVKSIKPLRVSLPEACCSRRYGGRELTSSDNRIAVWKSDHRRLAAYAQQGIMSRLVVCETREDCIRVVVDGRADITFLPYGAARRLVGRMGLMEKMDVRIIDPQRYEPSFPLYLSPKTDPLFASIVQKTVLALSRDRMVDLVHRSEARENVSPRLTREEKVLWCGVPILVALVLLLLVSSISRRRVASALHRSEMALQVADDALKEATTAREQMREALDRAEFAARSKTNFLATMSHEIRTPLNAVVGFSEFLAEPGLPSGKVQEYARGISFSANALLSLLNDILDISKFESGRTEGLDLRTGSCDVDALFHEMESVFTIKGREKNIDVVFEHGRQIPRLRLFEPRLRQILLNLVGNAVKFTDHGSVEVSASYRAGTLRIKVKDTGIGISPRGLKLVFDPFAQDMESRSGKAYAGTGLGLSIVKRLVEASGGTVRVESEIGRGSCFLVELPGVEVLPEASEDHASASPEDGIGAKLRRVVVVDDTKMNCRLLEAFCRKLGILEVRCFASGAETLAYFESGGEADLVLSDLWMPGMNGSELARNLAGKWPALPVVAVTADTDAGASFDVGVFRAILSKPVTMQKLRELLVRLAATGGI